MLGTSNCSRFLLHGHWFNGIFCQRRDRIRAGNHACLQSFFLFRGSKKFQEHIFLNEALTQNSTNPQKIVDLLVLIHKATNCQASKGQSFHTELFADPLVELGRKAIERDPLMGPHSHTLILHKKTWGSLYIPWTNCSGRIQLNPAGNRIKHELVPQFGR